MIDEAAPINAFQRATIDLFGLTVDAEILVASVALGALPITLGWLARKQPISTGLAFLGVSFTMAVAAAVPLNEISITYLWGNLLRYMLFSIPALLIGYGLAVFRQPRAVNS